MKLYKLKTRDLEHDYKSWHGYTQFTLPHLVNVIEMELNEPRSWFVERGGAVLNAYDFINLHRAGDSEQEILSRFASFVVDKAESIW